MKNDLDYYRLKDAFNKWFIKEAVIRYGENLTKISEETGINRGTARKFFNQAGYKSNYHKGGQNGNVDNK